MLAVNQLDGFGVEGADDPGSILFVTQASSTQTGNLVAPAGILAGDLLVFISTAYKTSALRKKSLCARMPSGATPCKSLY